MTGSTLTTLAANPDTSTLSSTVSTTAASPAAASPTAASPARNAWTSNFLSIVLRLSSVVCHPSPVVRRLSSVACRPSSVIRRLSFFVCHPSPVVRHLSSVACRPSSIIRRLSSIFHIFVPLRFAIFFYSKIFSIEPTHGAPPAPNRRNMG